MKVKTKDSLRMIHNLIKIRSIELMIARLMNMSAGSIYNEHTKLDAYNYNSANTYHINHYHNNVLQSFLSKICHNKKLSEKQAKLAKKLVSIYKNQLLEEFPDFDLIINAWNNSPKKEKKRRIYLDRVDIEYLFRNDSLPDSLVICLEFPYNSEMINSLKNRRTELAYEANNHYFKWNRENERWEIEISRSTLEWSYNFAKFYQGFDADDEFLELVSHAIEEKKKAKEPTVYLENGKIKIKNLYKGQKDYYDKSFNRS